MKKILLVLIAFTTIVSANWIVGADLQHSKVDISADLSGLTARPKRFNSRSRHLL